MKENHGTGITVSRFDYKGRNYPGVMYARKDGTRPGWFLWAISLEEYATQGGVHKTCVWPGNSDRQGWPTRWEAQAWARKINGGPASGFDAGYQKLHGLWSCTGFDAFGRHFNRSFRTIKTRDSFLAAMARGDNRIARY